MMVWGKEREHSSAIMICELLILRFSKTILTQEGCVVVSLYVGIIEVHRFLSISDNFGSKNEHELSEENSLRVGEKKMKSSVTYVDG